MGGAVSSVGLREAPACAPPLDRDARAAAITALMGAPNPSVSQLARGIRETARYHFRAHVEPLVAQHWPEIQGTGFHQKLRIGASDLYASAPYTALLCGTARPPLIRLVTDLGNALPIPAPALGLLGRGAMFALGRLAYPDQHRRIAFISAFIVVADHVLDHYMDEPPRERGALLEAVIAGRVPPDRPGLALTRALAVAMSTDLSPRDQRDFDAAMAQVYRWIRAEVRGLLGEPDPQGFGHRRAGVEGTIDGLLFPVVRFAGPHARGWMVDVSMFVQILDDVLDVEADLAAGRPTPATEGAWTLGDVEAAWHRTIAGIEQLVRSAGLGAPRYVRFVRDLYVYMMVEVVQAMISHPDDGMETPP